MTRELRVLGMALALALAANAPARADSVGVGDQVYITNPGSRFNYGTSGGGPFQLHVVGSAETFQTFCLERGETISWSPDLYTVTGVSDSATKGGLGGATGGQDPLSDQTKWAYYYFRNPGAAGSPAVNWGNGAAVQEAIWYIENEIPDGDLGHTANPDPYAWSADGLAIFNATLGLGTFGVAGWEVRALNLGTGCQTVDGRVTCRTDSQDLLTLREQPVPEPASLVLLGSGLLGLAAWRRRKA